MKLQVTKGAFPERGWRKGCVICIASEYLANIGVGSRYRMLRDPVTLILKLEYSKKRF
jgi:hypothetical protein